MALFGNCSRFLFYAKSLGTSFDKTLMLGRLHLYATRKDIEDHITFFKNHDKDLDEVQFKDEYSEPLFQILGSTQTDSIDFSNYEKATIIHDLNRPIPDSLKGGYTAVVDGGTIEHVFNFPVAIKNCMDALAVGGHYIGITPVNNTMGHGFYQFSPELYFNMFRKDYGFEVKKMIIVTEKGGGQFSDWYEVMDPSTAESRVVLVNTKPTYLMVLAQKTAQVEFSTLTAQQSDYRASWAIHSALQEGKPSGDGSPVLYWYRKYMPKLVKNVIHNLKEMFTRHQEVDENLGQINPEHFKKITL